MKKGVHNILLLVAVITVLAHSTSAHHHHDETTIAMEHHEEEEPSDVTHHDNGKDDHDGIFSFAQLDESFVPVNSQKSSFELPLTYLPALIATYLADNFSANTKTQFGWYKEYPPPDKNLPPSSHRGPPTA